MPAATISDGDRQPDGSGHRQVNYGGFALFYARQARRLCLRHDDRHIQISVGFSPAAVKIKLRDSTDSATAPIHEAVGERVSVIPPRQPYVTEWRKRADLVNIYLEPSFVVRAAYESMRGRVIDIEGRYLIRDPFLQLLGASLREEFKVGTPNLLYAESIATVAAVHLVRNYANVAADARNLGGRMSEYWLGKAKDYIEANLGANIGLIEIAAELGMSPHYFAELFRNTTGLTPHRYVTHRRIECAKRKIERHNESLGEIAQGLGFGTQSYFTQVFARWVGTTPRVYRIATQANVRSDSI